MNPEDTGVEGQEQDIGGGNTFYPFKPKSGTYNGQEIDPNGCYTVNLHSGGTTRTCRWEALDLGSKIGDNGYRIDLIADLGDRASSTDPHLEITSGGPGSTPGNCCGFTARINIDDGTLHLESEDWTEGSTTGAIYCDDHNGKPKWCSSGQIKSISSGKPLYNTKNIKLSWIVQRTTDADGKPHATYTAIATGPAGTVTSNPLKDPPAHKGITGPPIIPFHPIAVKKKVDDGDRIRADSCETVDFHTPKVTILPKGS